MLLLLQLFAKFTSNLTKLSLHYKSSITSRLFTFNFKLHFSPNLIEITKLNKTGGKFSLQFKLDFKNH